MRKEKSKIKTQLLEAIQILPGASVSEICKAAGTSRVMFYFYYNKDLNFRREVLESQRLLIDQRINEITAV